MSRDALELESRRTIYQFILDHPGSYLRQMEGDLGMAVGQLEYHLRFLVKEGLLTISDDGFYKRYFAASEVSHSDKPILSVLRQKVPRRIILHILLNPSSSFQDLTIEIGISKSTMSFHLKKLLEAEVITRAKKGRQSIYDVVNPDRVAKLVLTYR